MRQNFIAPSYAPSLLISPASVQALLAWMTDQCEPDAARITHMNFVPLYAHQIVNVVKLATELGISYAVLGVQEAAIEYCRHYGPDATRELLETALWKKCGVLEGIVKPLCT